jgi:hypothetical protein
VEYGAEFERRQFELYEARRLSAETHANAVVAAALAVAAFVLADYGRKAHPALGWLVAALLGVAWTFVLANVARVVSWTTPRWRGGAKVLPEGRRSDVVSRTLAAIRDLDPADTLPRRQGALAHWHARAISAWQLGELKRRWLDRSLWGLAGPLAYFAARLAS